MPIDTCTIAESTLSADTKHALAGEIATAAIRITAIPAERVLSSFQAAQRISPWKAGAFCPSQVMNKAGSPEVDEDRQCVPASNS
jgi:hypothetical protein